MRLGLRSTLILTTVVLTAVGVGLTSGISYLSLRDSSTSTAEPARPPDPHRWPITFAYENTGNFPFAIGDGFQIDPERPGIAVELKVPFVFRIFQSRAEAIVEREVRYWCDRVKGAAK